MERLKGLLCENPFCKAQAKVGLSLFDKQRNPIFTTAFILAALALVLAVAGTMGASTDKTVISDVYWSRAKITNSSLTHFPTVDVIDNIYIGINAVVFDTNLAEMGMFREMWSDISNCSESKYCEKCKDAATATFSTAIISCISKLPTLNLIYKRRNPSTDTPLFKFISMLSTIISLASLGSSMSTFSLDCHENLPETTTIVHEGVSLQVWADWELGPGWWCMAMSFLCSCILFVIFILTPIPQKSAGYEADENTTSRPF